MQEREPTFDALRDAHVAALTGSLIDGLEHGPGGAGYVWSRSIPDPTLNFAFGVRRPDQFAWAGAAALGRARAPAFLARDDGEIALLRDAANLADVAYTAAVDRIHPELRAYEIVRNVDRSVRGAGGGYDGVVVVSRDDTERQRAEEALREASATLRSFYDTAPVMMGVVEVQSDDILHLTDNAATGRFFGIDPERLARRRASELGVPTGHLREWVRRYRESERTGQPVRFEYPHEAPDGTR